MNRDTNHTSGAPSAKPTKRDLIVEAARVLFLEGGYGTTSMDALAAKAGVSKPTIYSYFDNKDALFGAVMVGLCADNGCNHPSVLSIDSPPEVALRDFACNMIGLVQPPEERDIFRVVLAESIKFPKLGEAFWSSGPEPAIQILTVYLTEQVKRGTLSVDDPATAAKQFIGMVKWPHSMPELFGIGEPASIETRQRALDQAIAIFLKGTCGKRD